MRRHHGQMGGGCSDSSTHTTAHFIPRCHTVTQRIGFRATKW